MVVELLAGIVVVLVLVVVLLVWRLQTLKRLVSGLAFDKKSLAVRHGKMSEQFFPFMKHYPYQPSGFRFLGTPVDGVQFEPDRVVLVEFKTGSSRLSAKQKEIKTLVEKGKVEFKEIAVRK